MYALMARTILLYLLIVAGLRIMGKRQIGELQPSELVVTILISNIATLPIQDVDVPLSGGIVPILTIVCFEVFISGLTMRSRTARRLFCGGPKMVIRDGQIMQKELRDLRFSVDDLIEQLRAAGYFDPSEVLFAVVETTGSLSVYPRFAARPATGGDLGLHRDDFIDAPPVVIVDQGRVLPASLDYCGVSPVWLQKALEQEGIAQKDIFLMTCDRRRKYHIVKKDKT